MGEVQRHRRNIHAALRPCVRGCMMFHHRRVAIALIVVLAGIALVGAATWRSVIPGLSSARSEPPAIEVSVATLLLRASVPAEDRTRTNPLGGDPAGIAAG